MMQYRLVFRPRVVAKGHDDRNGGDVESCSRYQFRTHRANKRNGNASFFVVQVGRFLLLRLWFNFKQDSQFSNAFSNAISQHYGSKQDKTMAKYKSKQYVLYICVEQPKRAKGQTHSS